MKQPTMLIDKLIHSKKLPAEIVDDFKKAIVIDGTACSNYYFEGTSQEIWRLDSHFPNVAPPFENFFIEFRAPHQIVSEDMGTLDWKGSYRPSQWGILFRGQDWQELEKTIDVHNPAWQQELIEHTLYTLSAMRNTLEHHTARLMACDTIEEYDAVVQTLPEEIRDNGRLFGTTLALYRKAMEGEWDQIKDLYFDSKLRLGIRWTVSGVLFARFLDSTDDRIAMPFWSWEVMVKDDGTMFTEENGAVQVRHYAMGDVNRYIGEKLKIDYDKGLKQFEEVRDGFMPFLHTGLLTMSFMHCKNVSLEKCLPEKVKPTKKQRHWNIQPTQPMPYHVLHIDPMKQVLKKEGESEKTGLQRALHICRGHFRTYGPDGKLFGKYVGTYWSPMTVRGTAKAGTSKKDYKVSPKV